MTAIYLDHNATTPIDPAVRAEMDACMDASDGNPSSIHGCGQAARRVLDVARARVARLIGAAPEELVFTSGGTEADNLAILGSASAAGRAGLSLCASGVEHQAVLNPCRHLGRSGRKVEYLAVDGDGVLDLDRAAEEIGEGTGLVSVMLANNDTGVIQPVAAAAELARARGALFHTDAVQAAGKVPIDVTALGADLLSISAHKLHGPKGVGALYVRRGVGLSPLLFGGHQERSLRPGTENVAAIAGFGKACALGAERLERDARAVRALRDAFEAAIVERIPNVTVYGREAPRLPNTSAIGFAGLDGEMLAINLDLLGLAVSTGAACTSGSADPSHVLLAMGRPPGEARSLVRFSFGRTNAAEEAAIAIDLVCHTVAALRGGNP